MRKLLSLTILSICLLAPAFAQGLSLTIDNPAAGQDFVTKRAGSFIFRVNGCMDLSKVHVKASAEGIVDETRRSVALHPSASRMGGVYVITPEWSRQGKWVVAITANCLKQTAGAIVPVGITGFVRESTQLLPRAPLPAEVEAALKNYIPAPPLQ